MAARIFLAHVLWLSADLQRSRQLIEEATRLGNELGHLPSTLNTLGYKTFIEIIRNDPESVAADAEALFRVSREHGAGVYVAFSGVLLSWAQGRLNNARRGADDLRKSLAELVGQGNRAFTPVFHGFLAELETAAGETERALAAIDEGLTTARDGGQHFADAFLYRLRGDILLKRSPADPRPAEEAYRTSIAIAKEQGALSYELLASLALAKLYQSTSRLAEAHAVLAPALEGFAPTPEMPEIAEAKALLATLRETDEVRAQAAQQQRLTQLHVAYGNALIAARGSERRKRGRLSPEPAKSAVGEKRAPERLAADYGLWASSYTRGELSSMRSHAAALLADVEEQPDSPEAGVAYRVCGVTSLFAGEYADARDHLERALALFAPGRDDDLAFRFGIDVGVAAMANLAISTWALGNVEAATSLVGRMHTRIGDVKHVNTRAFGKMNACMFELMRRDRMRVVEHALELASLVREYDPTMFRGSAAFLEAWAKAAVGAPGDGLEGMRRGVELLREQNVLWFDGLLKIALAEAEAAAGDLDRALAALDEGLATAERTGYRAFEGELHRVRAEILLKHDPANPAPAEEAFLAAIAVAKQQGTRSFGLRAALSLARLYRLTGRPAVAHAVLAPALEGFSPTPEMPEIAEAQALLAALAGTEEVKNAAASRQRRLQLQTNYSKALMLSRGFGSEDAKAAFTHTQELASAVDNAAERFDAYYGLYMGSLMRGELRSARETSENFLSEAEKEERMTEAAAARRSLGLACLFQGELAAGRAHFEQALRVFDPERDREAKFRFGPDAGVSAAVYLALANWLLGEAEPARNLIEEAIARAVESAHAPTLANAYYFRALFDGFRDDAEAARRAADSVLEVSRAHGLGLYQAGGALLSGWARARLGDRAGITELRQALAAYAGQEQVACAVLPRLAGRVRGRGAGQARSLGADR